MIVYTFVKKDEKDEKKPDIYKIRSGAIIKVDYASIANGKKDNERGLMLNCEGEDFAKNQIKFNTLITFEEIQRIYDEMVKYKDLIDKQKEEK